MNRTLVISNPRSGSSSFAYAHGNYYGEISSIKNGTATEKLLGCTTIADRVNMLSSKDNWTVKFFLVDCEIDDKETKNVLQNLFKISNKQFYLKRNLVDQLISYNTASVTGIYNYFHDIDKFAYVFDKEKVDLQDTIQKTNIYWSLTYDQIHTWISRTKYWEKYILENYKPNIIHYTETFIEDIGLTSTISRLSDNKTYNSNINICYNEIKIRKKLKKIIRNI